MSMANGGGGHKDDSVAVATLEAENERLRCAALRWAAVAQAFSNNLLSLS